MGILTLVPELFRRWTYQVFAPGVLLRAKYNAFKELLAYDEACLTAVAQVEDACYAGVAADPARVRALVEKALYAGAQCAGRLKAMNPARYADVPEYLDKAAFYVRLALDIPAPDLAPPYVLDLEEAAERPQAAGGKAAALGTARLESYAPIPPGVVATASAFSYFLEANELRGPINQLLAEVRLDDAKGLAERCRAMQALVLEAQTPPEIREALARAVAVLPPEGGTLAVRSSAVQEDGAAGEGGGFAGCYESFLHVAPEDLDAAYKRVLASKYGPRAVTYRVLAGFADEETPMAVLFMPMVKGGVAGVVYTHDVDPSSAVGGVACVYAGGAPTAEEGGEDGESGVVHGGAASTVCFLKEAHGPEQMGQAPPQLGSAAAVLARHALELEELFGCPQDVEWALDEAGRPHILQSRPLFRQAAKGPGGPAPPYPSDPGVEPLLDGAAPIALGTACGRVVHLQTLARLDDLGPEQGEGLVLVAAALWPELTRLLPRLAAVVAATGSRAGHFASVAREFGTPVLVAGPEVFQALAPEAEVTVDGTTGRVFPGRVEALQGQAAPRPRGPAAQRLAKAMEHLARLNLTDPRAAGFTPKGCKSVHDVVRFCHEKAVTEMFQLAGSGGGPSGSKRLDSRLPLTFYVLDVGGGLFDEAAAKKRVTPEDIKSLPLWAFWLGLAADDIVWREGLTHVDWNEADRMAGGIVSRDSRLLASYAIVAADYAHIMLRFGYHFAVVDSFLDVAEDARAEANYVSFRFKGGGGGPEGRGRRLAFITKVLEHFGFSVTVTGDMLEASSRREPAGVLQRRLHVLGRVLARTRLMDMELGGEEGASRAAQLAEDFIRATETRQDDA